MQRYLYLEKIGIPKETLRIKQMVGWTAIWVYRTAVTVADKLHVVKEQKEGRGYGVMWFIPASLVAQSVKNLPAVQESWVWSLGWEDPLMKETANHSSILAWKIPWTEEPARLQSTGSQESDTTQQLNHHHGAVSDNGLFGFLGSWPKLVSSFESLFIKTNPFKSPIFNVYLISLAFPEVAIILSSEFQDQYLNIFLRVPAYIRILNWFILLSILNLGLPWWLRW